MSLSLLIFLLIIIIWIIVWYKDINKDYTKSRTTPHRIDFDDLYDPVTSFDYMI